MAAESDGGKHAGVDVTAAPYRPLAAPPPAVDVQHCADGSVVLTCPHALGPVAETILEWLHHWAGHAPGRVAFAQRDALAPDQAWRRLTYGTLRAQAEAIAQGLLDLGVAPGERLLVLSGNSLEHAALVLGAMTVGIVVVPVTPAYALADPTLTKLLHVADVVEPAVVFAQDGTAFASALQRLHARGARVIVVEGESGVTQQRFATLIATAVTEAVATARAAVGPDTVAKILFTSGSTGKPKGVINTQRMMCVNQAMAAALRRAVPVPGATEQGAAGQRTVGPAAGGKPPVLLSWLPWSHTMGGNALFNRTLRTGGTLYLDDGRPLPGEIGRTIRNLREVLPGTFSNVPAAFAMLADELEADPEFCRQFFANLESMSYASAGLPDELWHRIQRLAVQATGMRVPFTSAYGSTETAPMITSLYWVEEGAGLIGLPPPGVALKLVPLADGRHEIRVRGPNVTPGYYREPELTRQAFDAEGFYCMGDAARFVDPQQPLRGLRFAGRVKEDFKLQTGTWVAAGPLRSAVLESVAPLLQDLVLTGHDRAYLGVLAWPSLPACRKLLQAPQASLAEVLVAPQLRAALAAGLARHNAAHSGSSQRIARLLLLAEPPSAAQGETNEKAYINPAAVLARRQDQVQQLYAEPPGPEVLVMA